MARARARSTPRWLLAGVASACSIALMAVAPALAGPVVPSESAVVLPGAVAPDVPVTGYPAAIDATWTTWSTPDRRLTVAVDGWVLGVACLDLCGATLSGDYSIAPDGPQMPAVVRIVAAARATSAGLSDPAEAAAVQAAIWFVTAGFVLDADVDPTIRQRVADLVASSEDPVNPVVGTPVGAVLVAEPGAPRLMVIEAVAASPGVERSGEPAETGMIAAHDVDPSGLDVTTTSLVTSTATSTSDPATSSGAASSAAATTTSGTATSSTATTTSESAVWYENCTAVRAALGRALLSTEPGFRAPLDGDGDGIACEGDTTSTPATTATPATAPTSTAAAAGGGGSGSSGTGPLAATGFAANRPLIAGVALVLLGGATMLASRPRRGGLGGSEIEGGVSVVPDGPERPKSLPRFGHTR